MQDWIQVIPHLHDEASSTSLLLTSKGKEGKGQGRPTVSNK